MLLAFWQFASGGMLFWSLAAAAPLLIHLLTRQRYRQVTWAAMEYLLAAVEKNRRRWQVEHWLLLAVRTLLLLLFSLALADPTLSISGGLFFSGKRTPTHEIFVLDGSYSMDFREQGVSRFEQAKEQIRQRVRESSMGDGFSLILLTDVPRVVIGPPVFDTHDLLEELDNLALTYTTADAAAALSAVEQVLAVGRSQHAHLTRSRITWLGDLEKTTWGTLASAEAQERCKKLSESAVMQWEHVSGTNPISNRALVQLEIKDLPVTVDREFTIAATVQHYGVTAEASPLVSLLIDGEVVAQQRAELPANGQASLSFQHRFAAPGDHAVELQLPADALPADDRRYAVVSVREALRVLCIYGRSGDTQYISAALAPEKSPAARVIVEEASAAVLAEKSLSSYDAVFMTNVPQLTQDQLQILATYVQAGGGLVIFPGDQTSPDSFTPSDAEGAALLPATIQGFSANGEYHFDPQEYRHELVAPFRGFEKAGLLTAPIWKYAKLQIPEMNRARVPLRFQNGDAAIVEHAFAKGRVALFAVPASPNALDDTQQPPTPWTALPTWPCFPPLVQETLSLVAKGRDQAKIVLVNEPIGATLHTASPQSNITLQVPSEASNTPPAQRVSLASTGDVWRWSWEETSRLGIYAANYEQLPMLGEKFAVNLDPRESALTKMEASELPREFATASTPATTAQRIPREAGQNWFRWLLLGVLGCLLLEAWLTARFGGGGA
jgi:Aerotolerance regulator N-terminal/von Willebrand factor type A domain